MGVAVGIDLGTTNSCVAVVQANRARVVEDQAGRRIHPSVVSFNPEGKIISGHAGKERQIIDAANTVYSFKRLLGRDLGTDQMKRVIAELPYEVVVTHGGIPAVKVRGREISLPEISAMMLKHLRTMCEEILGCEIDEAVITVPANFNDVQRSSTKVAGRVAGFNVLRILNEPTAAALAYGFGGQLTERIAIYDFGGGTFDITIVELADDIFEVLSTAGNTYLGGDDFDKKIVEEMRLQFQREHDFDLAGDAVALQRIRSVAEKVKCQLSSLEEVQATLREIIERPDGSTLDFHFKMNRRRFEKIIGELVEESLGVCGEALKLAGLDRTSLDNLVLVGGTTRIPLVRQKVAEYFGMRPRTEVNPDEVVAIGAAIQAFSLTGEQLPADAPVQKSSAKTGAVVPSTVPARRRSDEPLPPVPVGRTGPAPSVAQSRQRTIAGLPRPKEPGGTQAEGEDQGTAPFGLLDVDVKRRDSDLDLDVKYSDSVSDQDQAPRSGDEDLGLAVKKNPSKGPPLPPMADDLGIAPKLIPSTPPTVPTLPPPGPSSTPPPIPSSRPPIPRQSRPAAPEENDLFGDIGLSSPQKSSSPPVWTSDAAETLPEIPTSRRPSDPDWVTLDSGEFRLEDVAESMDQQEAASRLDDEVSDEIPAVLAAPTVSISAGLAENTGESDQVGGGAWVSAGLPSTIPGTEGDEVVGLPELGSETSDAGGMQRLFSSPPPEPDGSVAVMNVDRAQTALLLDVTPRALGVATAGGFCDTIIERNAAIPVEQSRLFTTSTDNQTDVSVDVYQGESRRIEENTRLGQVQLSNIRSAPRGEIKIRVSFEIDTDGILGVSACNEETNEAQRTKIVLTGGMDDAKIEALVEKYAEK